MLRGLLRWLFRTSAVVALAAFVVKVANRRRDAYGPPAPLFPAIGGDTWPPVPSNPRHG